VGEITHDGFNFASDWIDTRIATITNPDVPGALRRVNLEREISDHARAMERLLPALPNDLQAIAKAYLAALEIALAGVNAEMLKGHRKIRSHRRSKPMRACGWIKMYSPRNETWSRQMGRRRNAEVQGS
jgi:hypothetical protein